MPNKLFKTLTFLILGYLSHGQWEQVSDFGQTINKFHEADDKVWAIGDNGLLLSSDLTFSDWQLVETGLEVNFNDIYFNNNQGFVLGNEGTLLISDDFGETWTQRSVGTTNDLMAISFVSGSQIYIGTLESISKGTLLKSIDGGMTWSPMTVGESSDFLSYSGINDVHFDDENIGFLISKTTISRTLDGGENWSNLATGGNDYKEILINGDSLYFPDLGGQTKYITYTHDLGESTSNISTPNVFSNALVSQFLVGFDFESLYTVNGDFSGWATSSKGPDYISEIQSAYQLSDDRLIAYSPDTYRSIVTSNDGGQTWETVLTFDVGSIVKLDFPSPNVGYGVNDDGYVFKTTDNGVFWNIINRPASFELNHSPAISFYDENTGMIVGHKDLDSYGYTTSDGGTTWQEWVVADVDECDEVVYLSQDTILISTQESLDGAYRSIDGGQSWNAVSGLDYVYDIEAVDGKVYAVNQLTQHLKEEGVNSNTASLLGYAIASEHSMVEDFVRIEQQGAYVKRKNDVFEEKITFVDPSFFHVFDFPMITEDTDPLSSKNGIVISFNMAKKYFADEDPVGKELQLFFTAESSKTFIVTGVMEKYSDYASFYYDFYVPFDNLFDLRNQSASWGSQIDATFILTTENHDLETISNSFDSYKQLINTALNEEKVIGFELYPLYDLSERCHEIRDSVSFTAPAFTRISLAIIAAMLLAMAVFNFINISISSYAKRLREIAVRKVIGGNRRQIVMQFFIENFLLCLFSFLLGIYLSMVVFTPGLNYLIPLRIPSSFSSISFMIVTLISLFAAIVLMAGIYPSNHVAKFSSTHILKGVARFKQNSFFSKMILGSQFILAFITIVGAFVFIAHSQAMFKKDWGYNPEKTLMIRAISRPQADLIKAELQKHPDVELISLSKQSHIGAHNREVSFEQNDVSHTAYGYQVDELYHKALGLKLHEGRWFDGTASDFEKSVIVNETLVKQMNWDDPFQQEIVYQGTTRKVIGVVSDFHFLNFYNEIEPLIFSGFYGDPTAALYYLVIRSKVEDMQAIQIAGNLIWDEVAPNEPFVSMLQEESFDGFYNEIEAENFILIFLAGISIIIASLGLFGLFSFTIQRRLKEFSIRKVLGATPLSIVTQVSKSYLIIIICALIIGAPIGFLMISKLLSLMYPVTSGIGTTPFILAFLITGSIISLTIGGQVLRAVKVNPVENLRGE